MLVVRYQKKDKIIDLEVTFETAHSVHKHCKRKYLHADLILIDIDGIEYCVC